MKVHVLDHPVAKHFIDQLRDVTTPPPVFRHLCNQVTTFLTIEATRDLPLGAKDIQTPMESVVGHELNRPVVVVAILRAGMGMIEKVVQILPDVSVGYIGMERDSRTAEAKAYYCKLPQMKGHQVLVVDPMLATGGSAEQSLDEVYRQGAERVKFLCIVAAPEGISRLQERYPEMDIYVGALDRELNDKKYILPGLGDFGDRLYGTE